MERLLEDVATHGWSAQAREAFVRKYDRAIGELLIDLLVEHGLLAHRRAAQRLRSYIESRLKDQRAGPEDPLWEIVEEVYMRIYTEIFQKKLIASYVRSYLLYAFSLAREARAATDYFFERFLTEHYPTVRATLQPGESALLKLLEAFVKVCGRTPSEKILSYIGEIGPRVPRSRRWAQKEGAYEQF